MFVGNSKIKLQYFFKKRNYGNNKLRKTSMQDIFLTIRLLFFKSAVFFRAIPRIYWNIADISSNLKIL